MTLREKIRASELTIGSWITIGSPAIAEILARARFDWLVIDLEHSSIGIETAADLIRTIDLCGCSPLVRLTSNNPDQIKRVMDAGAHGIVVPSINSAQEAADAVAATRYAPRGQRGVGLARAQGYGATFPTYLDWQRDGPIVIVQIEHRDAVDNLAEILAVPDVDGFLIGPYDLSCSMGIPGEFQHPTFLAAMHRIHDTATELKRFPGIHQVEPDLEQLMNFVAENYRLIAFSVDMRILDVTARAALSAIRAVR